MDRLGSSSFGHFSYYYTSLFQRYSTQAVTVETLKDRVFRQAPLPKGDHKNVVAIMKRAGIEDIQATPKGLRHGFATACLNSQISLSMVQKWVGHSLPTTTAIYANAFGEEERNITRRLWDKNLPK